jgi:nucleotide-binding universal stress UspA family protein
MIERIIVPVDGSALSEQALPFGTLMARTYGCPIELTHVVELPMYVTIADPSAIVSPEAVEDYLTSLADRIPAGLTTKTTILSGRPAAELLALAENAPHTMIVMATHGRGGMPRALLGSIADKVVRGATMPVGLVRANDTSPRLPDQFQRICMPLDGSELSEQALRMGIDLSSRCGATLSLLRVVEPVWVTPYAGDMYGAMSMDPQLVEELMSEMDEDARSSLAELSRTVSESDVPVEWTVSQGRAVTEILRHAKETAADLILTTTHGRGGLSRLFLGSVTTGLIHQSPVPLIVIPAQAVTEPNGAAGMMER